MEKLTDAGLAWARKQAEAGSIVALVALEDEETTAWPPQFVETSRKVANEEGAIDARTAKPVTIRDLALHRGAKADDDGNLDGGEFARVGLAIIGGCEVCGATVAAYNAYPSKSGYWRCEGCIDGDGWTDVAEANHDIFGADDELDEAAWRRSSLG